MITPPCFVQNEIALATSSMDAIVESAEGWNEGKGAFHQWNALKEGAFPVAYQLYLCLKEGGPDSMALVLQRPYFASWQRLPKGKPANLAMYLVLKPSTEDERKLCSSYAAFLLYAETNGVRPSNYAEVMRGVTLAQCVAERRKAKVDQTSTTSNNAPAKEVVEADSNGRRTVRAVAHVPDEVKQYVEGSRRVRCLGEFVLEMLEGGTLEVTIVTAKPAIIGTI